jgi:6-phosphogluconolactonase
VIRLIAGGYAEAGSQGLYPLRLVDGALHAEAPVPGIVNVSGGTRVVGSDRWFLVDERAGEVLHVDAAADWRVIARSPSGGKGPCHLALAPDARTLAVANYDSGDVAVLEIVEGGLVRPTAAHREAGSGPNAERQAGPHAHWVGIERDGRLYATDLGTDRVLAFASERLDEAAVAYAAPPGSGPRQITFHPSRSRAYLVSELASTLTVLDCSGSRWITLATLSTLPPGAPGDSLGGAVAIDNAGRRLYVSNRGHDSVATFALDAQGDAVVIGHVASGGSSPRFLLLADGCLLVAHEQSGGITLLPLDGDGLPQPTTARADVPGAAFLGVVS